MSEFRIMKQGDAPIEAVMRLRSVKRWHMIDTTRTQTLAEHSANVAALVLLIGRTAPGMFFDTATAVMAALTHDVGEVFMGDIPTMTKPYLLGADELELNVTPRVLQTDVAPKEKLLIKICDLADGIRFIRIHGVDVTAAHAQAGLEKQLRQRYIQATAEHWPAEVVSRVRHVVNIYAYE